MISVPANADQRATGGHGGLLILSSRRKANERQA